MKVGGPTSQPGGQDGGSGGPSSICRWRSSTSFRKASSSDSFSDSLDVPTKRRATPRTVRPLILESPGDRADDPRTHGHGQSRGIDVDAVARTPKGTNFVETTGTPVVQHSVRHPLRGSARSRWTRSTFLLPGTLISYTGFFHVHHRPNSYGALEVGSNSGWTPVFLSKNSAFYLVSLMPKSRPLYRSISMKQSRPHGKFRSVDLLSLQDAEEAFPPPSRRHSGSNTPRPATRCSLPAHRKDGRYGGEDRSPSCSGCSAVPARVPEAPGIPDCDTRGGLFLFLCTGSNRALPEWVSQPAARRTADGITSPGERAKLRRSHVFNHQRRWRCR